MNELHKQATGNNFKIWIDWKLIISIITEHVKDKQMQYRNQVNGTKMYHNENVLVSTYFNLRILLNAIFDLCL